MKISVIGSGSWGTALSQVIVDNGYECLLYSRDKKIKNEINLEHTNRKYLKDIVLPEKLVATSSLEEAVQYGDLLVVAVPTKAMREVCKDINKYLDKSKYIIHVSKGLEIDTNLRMSEVIKEVIDKKNLKAVGILSGPSHAEELVLRHPTVVAIASEDTELNQLAQKIFQNKYFRIYVNQDIIGVEIGGALKNVIALGCGIIDGLGLGDNAKAALITRGLIEITRMGKKLGAKELTFLGLGGIGDLVVTCTSIHSRNYKCGLLIGKGHTLDESTEKLNMVVEGVRTAKVCHQLAKENNVYMPITENIYKVLYEKMSLEDCVSNLMSGIATEELNRFE
ncbi:MULTISPECIES: NAD(P)H-dependent glycerol-3-phosphate dehydrogenase [unclassified Gemella]|uniref:NAD(P)H-dependent glycerol-3-phosphate dehydrogenase n=1 Tax=unclassified Gemella TaxID=2624949 RepID=UPI0015D0CE77|nr:MULTISPECIES: NAD(P)H-dependent glycerol-3-phosphate dehydrogenase [unclassified Gemella]MBF0710208.1 NAD(P)H-dependent glycerol-3-phosphate dehydrogenase [Gemella sp. GL1.1]NYS27552.1 NAD(P)H-dependent glycerol-3-phosphate dehydrogenase [Gemella sp. GL1]